jgi:ATP-dependent Lon protease
VRKDVGMTGEITLRGRVLEVGGVRNKVLAAHRSDLKTVILPAKNEKDLVDVPKKVQTDLEIVFVKHIDEVLEVALLPKKERKAKRKAKSEQEEVKAPQPTKSKSDEGKPPIQPGV